MTVSGTGLITAVAPGQAAVVLKMEQGGDSGVHIKTVLLTVSGEENPERPEPEGPTEEAVYAAITALKADYPEGMRWTNDDFTPPRRRAPAATAVRDLPSSVVMRPLVRCPPAHRSFEAIRVGDMIRIGDYHTVVVLEKKGELGDGHRGQLQQLHPLGPGDHPSLWNGGASPCAPATRHNEQERRPRWASASGCQ